MTMRNLILAGSTLALSLSFPVAAFAGSVNLTATLNGAGETKGGDTDGSGAFKAEIDPDTGDVCYTLSASGIGNATAAHIHEGAAGKDGKPVATVNVTGPEDDQCMAMEPEKLTDIAAAPWNYYVNVHTSDFAAGAIRGQLVGPDGATGPAPATVAEAPEAAADAAAPADEPAPEDSGSDEGAADETAAE